MLRFQVLNIFHASLVWFLYFSGSLSSLPDVPRGALLSVHSVFVMTLAEMTPINVKEIKQGPGFTSLYHCSEGASARKNNIGIR